MTSDSEELISMTVIDLEYNTPLVTSESEASGLTFIEQLHALSVQLCPDEKVPWLTGYNADTVIAIRGRCGRWSCSVCGAANGRRWLAKIINGMNTMKHVRRWYFITITAHEKWRGAERSLQNIRSGWKKLYNRIRRRYGVTSYVKVWEFHADGSFHLHVLFGRKIGKRWLKDNSRQCGMGYQVDSSQTKNAGQVAGYAAKYLLKSFENAHYYPENLRRIETSRDWTPLPDLSENDEYEWFVCQNREFQNVKLDTLSMSRKLIDMRPKK